MYLLTDVGQKLLVANGRRRPRFPVLVIGMGPDSFIAPCGWLPNMLASHCFILMYAAASRDEDKVNIAAAEYDLEPGNVSADYQALVRKALAEQGNKLVVCVCTETPHHHEQLVWLIQAGVKIILLDKPPVETYAQFKEIEALAKANGVLMLVSYQHTLNAATEQLALITADHLARNGADRVHVYGFFLQGWLYEPPMNIRQVWRLMAEFCGLLDIGTHACDGASLLAGAPVMEVLSSNHGKARIKERDKPALDNGRMNVKFGNGVHGKIEYHQALPGHADDIGWVVSLTNGDGSRTHLMWRMEWGPEALWVWDAKPSIWSDGGEVEANIDARARWVPHLRGNSPMFTPGVCDGYQKNPPGHYQGWDTMWLVFFLRAYRMCLAHTGDTELSDAMKPICNGRVPTFSENGGNSMGFVQAAIEAARTHRPVLVA